MNWPPHAPAPGQALILESRRLGVAHAAGGVRADGLEHVLDGDVAAVERARARSSRRRARGRACRAARAPSRRRESSCRSRRARRAPSKLLPRATSSIESAITSRLMSEARMPSVPIVMPSEIETVLNSIGVPPAARMPSFTCAASSRRWKLHGPISIQVLATPMSGLREVLVGEADGLEHGARRRAVRAAQEDVAPADELRIAHAGLRRRRRRRASSQLGYEPSVRSVRRELGEVHERARAAQVLPADRDVDVEQVLPRPAADRARLDLGQIDVAQREDAQRLEERARLRCCSEKTIVVLSAGACGSALRGR